MEYIKYLLKNKSKLLFHLFVSIFTISITTFLITEMEYVIDESSELIFILLLILLSLVFCIGNYQPYSEWKDGINRKS
jgi:hypothetical protein